MTLACYHSVLIGTQARYDSFLDLQDKLHTNICRKRSLVAIGTHDLSKIQGPFSYEAQPPEDIKFTPLKQTREFNAKDLMEFYKSDLKLRAFLPLIASSPVYPVIYDANRTVLSLPPIINGAHSAISLDTKDVFIECTATDLNKAKIVLNTMVTMFACYCEQPFTVEPVEVTDSTGAKAMYPDLSQREVRVTPHYTQPYSTASTIDGCSCMRHISIAHQHHRRHVHTIIHTQHFQQLTLAAAGDKT
jgi:phenylalanyl-tRNA synthetase beta chain